MKNILEKIKTEALKFELPIILDDMEIFLHNKIKKLQPKSILEIGTANGFSGACMLSACKKSKLQTIEKDVVRYKLAKKNLLYFIGRAKVINDDAIVVLKKLKNANKSFNFIFMDGPKGQYLTYLPYLTALCSAGGQIVCDNIFFHGMVNGTIDTPKSLKTMISKMQEFLKTATDLNGFGFEILNMADGVLVLEKIKK